MKQSLLSSVEADLLLEDVLRDAPSRSVSDTAGRFVRAFPPDARFRACCALLLLLEDDAGVDSLWDLGLQRRAAAYYTLSVAHCSNWQPEESFPARSPLFSMLLDIACRPSVDAVERRLVRYILASGCPQEVQGARPGQLIEQAANAMGAAVPSAAELRQSLRLALDTPWRLVGMDQPTADRSDGPGRERPCELHPPFLRPPLAHMEVAPWHFDVDRIATVASTSNGAESWLSLLSKALTAPLLPAQQGVLMRGLRESGPGSRAHATGGLPQGIPRLVETNPSVALDILRAADGTPHAKRYWDALATVAMTFHSVEVINQLAAEIAVPRDVTNVYITGCISTCQSIEVSSKAFMSHSAFLVARRQGLQRSEGKA